MDSVQFEDFFNITAINKDGKKFDKVSRLNAVSENYQVELILDVNTEIYPMKTGEKFTLLLARTLSLNGSIPENEGSFDLNRMSQKSLADGYDYVMYGKVYKAEGEMNSKM